MAHGAVLSRKIGSRYVAHKVLGRGASGTVWQGDGPDGPVAIKLLREDLASDQILVARFVQERTVLTSLEHPNIVGVHDLVVDGSDLALVMDLVHGTDLRGRLERDGVLAPQLAVAIVADVAEGLAAAHAEGVIHRDVKPENILLDASGGVLRARLGDFGIARLLDAPRRTRATRIVGTPDYLAPEVIEGCQPTAAVDVYALGTVLFELLTGWTPFGGAHPGAVLRRHVTEPVPVIPGLPEPLAQVMNSCLSKAPAVRLTAGEVAERLRQILPSVVGMPPFDVPDPAAGVAAPQADPPPAARAVSILDTPEVDESTSDTHISMRRVAIPAGEAEAPRRGRSTRLAAAIAALVVALAAAGVIVAFTVGKNGSAAAAATPSPTPTATPTSSAPPPPVGGPQIDGTAPSWGTASTAAAPVSTTLSGGLRAVAVDATTTYLFARGADSTILYATYDGTTLSAWQRVPGLTTLFDPAVVVTGTDRLDLFAVGADRLLEERSFSNGTWADHWTVVDSATRLGGSPAAAAMDPGHIDVVAAEANSGTLAVASDANGTWQSFQPLPTAVQPAFAPSLAAGPGGFTLLVARSGDDQVEEIKGTSGGTWLAPRLLSLDASSHPLALADGQGILVLVQNTGGATVVLTSVGAPPSPVPTSALGATPADTPAADVTSGGRSDLFTLAQNGTLYHAQS